MKKYRLIIPLMVILSLYLPLQTFAEENEQQENVNLAKDAKSALLMEQDTGKILFNKNAHEKLPPASMVKIMTLLITMEELERGSISLDETVQVSEHASSMGGSQVFLEEGEEVSIEDLIKSVAIASGNDASVALAETIAGSEEAFVAKMNDKSEQLNLEHTNFKNASGLPTKDQYSTAHDMAKIAQELLKYETITDYTSIYEDYLRKGEEDEFWLVNTNKLVRFYDGVDGLKTGYTSEAKYCLTATAKRDDMRVVAVVMGADTVKDRNRMISQMLDYSFNQYDTEKLYDKGDVIQQIRLLKADREEVNVVTDQSVSLLLRKGESVNDISTDIKINESISLPVKKGEQVGTMTVKHADEVVSHIPLTVEENIHRASYGTLFRRTIKNLLKYK